MRACTTKADRCRKIAIGIAVAGFWLIVWQILSMLVGQELLVPAPLTVAEVLLRSMATARFWQAVGTSLGRILCGFLAASAGGVALAVLTVRSAWLHRLFAPLLHCIKAAPVASFIILALVWLPTDILPAFICFLMVLPLVWNNVQQGIRETDRRLLDMARAYRLGVFKTWLRIRIPAVMPYAISALTTGLGFAWKSGIAAEVICQPQWAIGKQLYQAKIYLETPEVFAWTAMVILLSVLLERLLKRLLRGFSSRYGAKEAARI